MVLLLLFVVIPSLGFSRAQDLSTSVDVRTLSELPLDKLLHVRNSFELDTNEIDSTLDNFPEDSGSTGPQALRRSKPKPFSRGGWEDEGKGGGGGGKKGMQSIFQMSITALAFLAFGGYLLCLIVQSLKDKGGSKVIVVVSTTAAPVTMMALRRRRRRRPLRRRPVVREKRDANGDDFDGPVVDMFPHVDPEKMLNALVTLSEAYTQYHTVDYKRFNQTVSRF